MKKVAYLFLSALLLSACGERPKQKAKNDDVAAYALELDSAALYTQNYDSIARSTMDGQNPIRAFTVRAVDLLEAMGMDVSLAEQAKYNHVRVYLGIDNNNNYRLMLTPVDSANIEDGVPGSDVILKGNYYHGSTSGAVQNGQYVLDFTGPCPNSCPSNSPLDR